MLSWCDELMICIQHQRSNIRLQWNDTSYRRSALRAPRRPPYASFRSACNLPIVRLFLSQALRRARQELSPCLTSFELITWSNFSIMVRALYSERYNTFYAVAFVVDSIDWMRSRKVSSCSYGDSSQPWQSKIQMKDEPTCKILTSTGALYNSITRSAPFPTPWQRVRILARTPRISAIADSNIRYRAVAELYI